MILMAGLKPSTMDYDFIALFLGWHDKADSKVRAPDKMGILWIILIFPFSLSKKT